MAWSETEQRIIDAHLGERLLHLVMEHGVEWDREEPGRPMSEEVWKYIVSGVRRGNRELWEREKRENEALYARRIRVLEAEYQRRLEVIQRKLHTAEQKG